MSVFKQTGIFILHLALPLFIAINLYFCLIEIDPSLDFLNLPYHLITSTEYQTQLANCTNQNRSLISYFGVSSLKNMLNDMKTDRVLLTIKGLYNSFLSANWAIPATVPSMNGIGKDWLRDMLKAFYSFFGILLQPVTALAWLVYAIVNFVIEIGEVLQVLFRALGGYYNTYRCSIYPSIESMENMTRIMLHL